MQKTSNQNSASIAVLFKALILLVVALGVLLAYDHYWRKTNPNIEAFHQKIAGFRKDPDKPLVLVIGASLEMLSTPSTWQNQEFDWLRLIIQGARIDEFEGIIDDVIDLQPDLILIGMHLLVVEEFDEVLRAAIKPLLRAPLVKAGLVPRLSRTETSGCGIGNTDLPDAVDRVAIQFRNKHNDLDESSVIKTLTSTKIPVMIVRTSMFKEIEHRSDVRNEWIANFHRESEYKAIPVLQFKQELDQSYFCPDWLHMNRQGREIFSQWLKQEMISQLVIE